MANELAPGSEAWGAKQVRAQFLAIAWLRWRVLVNGFRRKGSVGDIVALAITVPIFSLMGLSVATGAGAAAWYFASHGQLDRVAWVLWGTFGLCQLLNINVGQPGTTFDPTQLIRFPLQARSYVFIRLFFGILSPANVMVAVMSFAIAVGVGAAQPSLWGYALVGMAVFAATNAVFTRMVFAWVDRWLSTRRAREVFTALIFLGSMGIQWVNFTFNPAYGRRHQHAHGLSPAHMALLERMYHHAMPWMNLLPPGLTGDSLVAAHNGNLMTYVGNTADCLLFALVFFAIFALRTRTEYRGEVFSDQANAVHVAKGAGRVQSNSAILPARMRMGGEEVGQLGVPPTIAAVFAKEILTIRRNSGVFYALVAPVVVVLLIAGRMASNNSASYIFPAALAYALVGVVPLAFNSFGLEGAGCQFYFMAPVRLRDVFLAKNMINMLLAYVEAGAVLVVVTLVGKKPTAEMLLASILWAAATLMITLTFGNRRSIAAPKKIDLGRTSSKQASPLSALLSIGLVFLSAAAGAGMMLVAQYLKEMWLLPIGMVGYCALAALVYWRGLASIESYALGHREEMFQELCKSK